MGRHVPSMLDREPDNGKPLGKRGYGAHEQGKKWAESMEATSWQSEIPSRTAPDRVGGGHTFLPKE